MKYKHRNNKEFLSNTSRFVSMPNFVPGPIIFTYTPLDFHVFLFVKYLYLK
jgi:hypothetical protein